MTTVFVLDDHEVVRQGIMRLIDAEPDMQAVGDAATAAEALARVPRLRPDVAVLDVRLPDGDGVTVCRELRSRMPELKVIMLTSYSDDEALFEAIMAGASGYLLKQILGQDLVTARWAFLTRGPRICSQGCALGFRVRPLGAKFTWSGRPRFERSRGSASAGRSPCRGCG